MINPADLLGLSEASGDEIMFRVFPRRRTRRGLLEMQLRRPWHLQTWPQGNHCIRSLYHAAWILVAFGLQLPRCRAQLAGADGSSHARFQARFAMLRVFLSAPGPNRKFFGYPKDNDRVWLAGVPISTGTATITQAEAVAVAAFAENK